MMASRLLLVLSLVAVALAANGSWAIVDNDYATIAMSCSFQTDTDGWVGGSSGSLQPLLLHTTNGGGNFTNAPINTKDAAFMSISMFDASHGVAGGLGFFGLPCGAVTSNGTWSTIHDGKEILCAFQSAQAITANTFVVTGAWATPGDFQGNGIQISTDGGNTWSLSNWNQGTDARYAYFVSPTVGYVSGGMWPSTSDAKARLSTIPFRMTQHVDYDGVSMSVRQFSPRASPVDGYQGVIAKTTDGGKTFNTVYNITGQGLYFNEIFCVDANTCWAAAEGIDVKTLAPTAVILATTDGFKTVQTQLTFPSGSLVTVSFINSTYGWAGGALLPSSFDSINDASSDAKPDAPLAKFQGVAFLTTNGGKTWTQYNELPNFYFMQISAVDTTSAYASGITSIGLSSLARYQSS